MPCPLLPIQSAALKLPVKWEMTVNKTVLIGSTILTLSVGSKTLINAKIAKLLTLLIEHATHVIVPSSPLNRSSRPSAGKDLLCSLLLAISIF